MHQPRAGQPNTHMHLRARALVDRVKVYVYAFTVHAMLQANHHPAHSTAYRTPQTTQQRQILRTTRNVHMPKLRVTRCPWHGKSGGLTIPLAQPHREIDL
jgi:hypothetical protein